MGAGLTGNNNPPASPLCAAAQQANANFLAIGKWTQAAGKRWVWGYETYLEKKAANPNDPTLAQYPISGPPPEDAVAEMGDNAVVWFMQSVLLSQMMAIQKLSNQGVKVPTPDQIAAAMDPVMPAGWGYTPDTTTPGKINLVRPTPPTP